MTPNYFPIDNPDQPMFVTSMIIPNGIVSKDDQIQYGAFNISVFQFEVIFPEKTPFNVSSVGVVNMINITLTLNILYQNKIVNIFSDQFLLTNKSTRLFYQRDYSIKLNEPNEIDFFDPIISRSSYFISYSITKIFYYNNIPHPEINTFTSNIPQFQVEWPNILPLIINYTLSLVIFTILVVGLIFFKKFKKKNHN